METELQITPRKKPVNGHDSARKPLSDRPRALAPAKEIYGIMGWFELIAEVARQADKELGGLGPFSAEEVAALVSSAFIGAESLYLLGAEKKGAPVRQSLRRVGDAIRMAEGKSSKR